RLQTLFLKGRVVVFDRLGRGYGAVSDGAHETHDVERRFREIDLAAEQRDARAIFLRLMNELETIAGRAGAAAQHANDEARVERRQLFQRSRSIIGDLEEFRPLRLREAGEAADDCVVD